MAELQQVQHGNAEFAVKLLQQLTSGDSSSNVLVSPYSLSVTMAMVLIGAKENSAKEIKAGLGWAEITDSSVHNSHLEAIKRISKSQTDVILETANKLFPDKSFCLLPDFVEQCSKFYQTDIESLNFQGNHEESRLHVNDWAQKQTRDNIKNLLPPGSVNPLVCLILANAVYFKGEWLDKFDEKNTKITDFHVNETTTAKVQMMSQKRKYNLSYDRDLGVQVLELPYKGNNVSMVLFVPTERFGLQKLQNKLSAEKIHSLLAGFYQEEVILSLPRMKLDYGDNLIPSLKALGINDIFQESLANFQGLSSVPGIYVSGVYHKAFIEVNEEGSEAAAATAVVMRLRCARPPPIRVTCDHPFMFMIRHKPSQSILFMGRFMKP